MTNKEKEKAVLAVVKKQSQKTGWKFKSYFIFKVVGDFFYDASFYANPKTKKIHGYAGFKPVASDDLFWDITRMPENKKLPLSFRAEAAFRIPPLNIYQFDIVIPDFETSETEIKTLLEEIEAKVMATARETPTIDEYLARIIQAPEDNAVALIVCLIQLNRFDEALDYINRFKASDSNSGYGFEEGDFFEVARRYLLKKNRKPWWKKLFS